MPTPTKNLNNTVPLTQDEAIKIGGAFQRIVELQATVIKTPTAEAELSGTLEFLANALLEHANEFIACWFAVRNEYEPLVGIFSRIQSRVNNILQQQALAQHLAQQAQAKQQAQGAATPASNIVTLGQEGK